MLQVRRRREGLWLRGRRGRRDGLRVRRHVLQQRRERHLHHGRPALLPQPARLLEGHFGPRCREVRHGGGGGALGPPLPPWQHAGLHREEAHSALRHLEPVAAVHPGCWRGLQDRRALRRHLLRQVRGPRGHARGRAPAPGSSRPSSAGRPRVPRRLARAHPEAGPLDALDGVSRPRQGPGHPPRVAGDHRAVPLPEPQRLQLLPRGLRAAHAHARGAGARARARAGVRARA
mmetsp:Transcript_30484/g.69357  ORF Transcript_30484/g.69357 Transcript_30484/m.69357 type:complete len:232 (-) Transcript_30484:71-766(-)